MRVLHNKYIFFRLRQVSRQNCGQLSCIWSSEFEVKMLNAPYKFDRAVLYINFILLTKEMISTLPDLADGQQITKLKNQGS